MSKIDFSKIVVKDINDKDFTFDIKDRLSNEMYMLGQNIVDCEAGRKIYHSEGGADLNQQEQQAVLSWLERNQYSFILRQKVEELFNA